jgi:hypothetical protein
VVFTGLSSVFISGVATAVDVMMLLDVFNRTNTDS